MIPALAALIPSLVTKGIDLFERKFQTDAEKQTAIRDYEVTLQREIQSAWDSEQAQLTARHNADMQSDSWLSKNVRPVALVYLMGLFTLAFFLEVPETVLEMLQNLLMTVFIFYFGARSLEKVTKMITTK